MQSAQKITCRKNYLQWIVIACLCLCALFSQRTIADETTNIIQDPFIQQFEIIVLDIYHNDSVIFNSYRSAPSVYTNTNDGEYQLQIIVNNSVVQTINTSIEFAYQGPVNVGETYDQPFTFLPVTFVAKQKPDAIRLKKNDKDLFYYTLTKEIEVSKNASLQDTITNESAVTNETQTNLGSSKSFSHYFSYTNLLWLLLIFFVIVAFIYMAKKKNPPTKPSSINVQAEQDLIKQRLEK